MDIRYWLGINLARGVGPAKVRRLLDHFGDLAEVWQATPADLFAAGLDRRAVENLIGVRAVNLDLLQARLEQLGLTALTWDSPDYPDNLRHIDAPPPVLYLKGALTPADTWAVAIVGTRNATPYGKETARDFALQLAANGVTVVSGLAKGIDTVAHKAALEAGGRTLAVLGCGLDHIYPPENRALAESIAEHGALISDYPLGTRPEAVNFPPRNRIISGLAKAVLVVEAGETSGALITTEFAAEQGRDVFAVPGNITQKQSLGPNRLIQNGAKVALSATDILNELNITQVAERARARAAMPADPAERTVINALSATPTHIDDLCVQLQLPMAELSGRLALMELKGLVRQVGGMNYVAAKEARAEYGSG